MRIVLDARKHADFGIGTYIRGLVNGFREVEPGLDLHLLGIPPDPCAETDTDGVGVNSPGEEQRTADDGRAWIGGDHFPWSADRSGHYGLAELVTVSRAARRLGADVLHAPHYVFPLAPPCPGVVTVHDCIHLRFPEQLPRRGALLYARTMLRRAVRAASAIIAVSHATRDDLVSLLGADPDRIVVVHNGCDPYFLEPTDQGEIEAIRRRLALPERFILHVGNPKPHKNIEGLVDAMAILARHPEIPLLQVGAPPEASSALRRHVAAAGLEDRVRFLGFASRPTLRALYRSCTVFAFPSLYEGFGLPPLEAMASGAAVVASSKGALPEVVGDSGVLTDPGDRESLAAALARVIDDEALRRDLGRRGRERAGTFRWTDAAARTLDVYREVGS